MGYNRSGTRRKQRLKRAKKQDERLARKAAADTVAEGAKSQPKPGQAAGAAAGKRKEAVAAPAKK